MINKKHKIVLTSYYSQSISWLASYLRENNVERIAFIMDAVTPRLQQEPGYVFKNKKMLEDEGFFVDVISLEKDVDYEGRLKNAQAIYVTGGNTFYLLRAIRSSGFDKIIGQLLDSGIIYVGESAGSYVTCPTIEMALWKHQDADIVGLEDLTGLGLVSFMLTVHYKPEFEVIIQKATDNCKYPVKILTDNQLILIENGKESIVKISGEKI